MPLRQEFPAAGSEYLGGTSDGYLYQTAFAGGTLEQSFGMVRQFLEEEGYGGLPLPENLEELKMFRLPARNRQILMFEDSGYVHNPIKILFPTDARQKRTLILEIYNEQAPNHLLRFHRRMLD
ncbi:MAG: hypothetical protein HY842_11785 [Bacteroidetes bacterium]|nr:hypothetical protein [Bacteroidota bacterium]